RNKHTPGHERTDHAEKALGFLFDRTPVFAVAVYACKAVEQGIVRQFDILKLQVTVIYAVEAYLMAAILDADAVARLTCLLANWHKKTMHALTFSIGSHLELCKNDHHPAVLRGVTDIGFSGAGVRRVQRKAPARMIINGFG